MELEANLTRCANFLKSPEHQFTDEIDKRRAALLSFRANLAVRRPKLVDLIIDEVGKLPAEAESEFDYALSFLDYATGLLENFSFSNIDGDAGRVEQLPIGVALLIAPYNDPLAGVIRKLAPAIAAGCPFIVQPSPLGMLTALAALEALQETTWAEASGILCCTDPKLSAIAMAHPDVNLVSFTGSVPTGRKVAAEAGRQLCRTVMELGGNAMFVVLEDADLERAAKDLVLRKRKAAGQACSAVNRVLVAAQVADQFREHLLREALTVNAGNSRAAGVSMGPVRTAGHFNQLCQLRQTALDSGEEELFGHSECLSAENISLSEAPFAFPFTILQAGAEHRVVLDDVEAFGPLLSLRPFKTTSAMFTLLASERQALVAYLYGYDQTVIRSFMAMARHGSIGINTTGIQGANLPTGGFGFAGYGREGGTYGLREFLAPSNIRFGL